MCFWERDRGPRIPFGFAGSEEGGEGVRRPGKGEEVDVEGSGDDGLEGEST